MAEPICLISGVGPGTGSALAGEGVDTPRYLVIEVANIFSALRAHHKSACSRISPY